MSSTNRTGCGEGGFGGGGLCADRLGEQGVVVLGGGAGFLDRGLGLGGLHPQCHFGLEARGPGGLGQGAFGGVDGCHDLPEHLPAADVSLDLLVGVILSAG